MNDLKDFAYSNRDVRVVFASGSVTRLSEEIETTLGRSKCFVVSTPGRSGLAKATAAGLEAGTRAVATFTGAAPHVPAAVVAAALEQLERSNPDCLVAVGGGSAIGLGKALARDTGLPLVAVPTTYSGSEMTDIWGVTDGERKTTGRDPGVAPRLVVYDPILTHTMPPDVTGPSGMNAIAHSVEALYASNTNPIVALVAADGIRRLARSLPVCVSDPENRAARRDALCGAHFCGKALDMTTMGLHHKLCHVLGGMFGLPHAITHAVLLPHVVAHNAPAATDAVATVAESIGKSDAASGLWDLNQQLGIKQTLGDLGLQLADIDAIIPSVTDMPYPNPVPVTADGVRNILDRAIAGRRPGGQRLDSD